MIELKNHFKDYKVDFQQDTGIDPKSDMALYIQYYHARMMDNTAQILKGTLIPIAISKLPPTKRGPFG